MNYKSIKDKKRGTINKEKEDLLEELALFEEWKNEILPELREMLISKKSAKEIAKKYSSHALARMVTIALTNEDASKALAACKDIIDRADGRAVETQKIEHKYNEMTEQQLDALLRSELESISIEIKSEEGDDGDGRLQ